MVEQDLLVDHNLKEVQVEMVVEMVEIQVIHQVDQETHLLLVHLKVIMVVHHQEQILLMVVVVVEQTEEDKPVLFNKVEPVEQEWQQVLQDQLLQEQVAVVVDQIQLEIMEQVVQVVVVLLVDNQVQVQEMTEQLILVAGVVVLVKQELVAQVVQV